MSFFFLQLFVAVICFQFVQIPLVMAQDNPLKPQSIESDIKNLEIEFYSKRKLSQKGDKTELVIVGRVSEEAVLEIPDDQIIPWVVDDEVKELKADEVFPAGILSTESDGRFALNFVLPDGRYQIPLTVSPRDLQSEVSPINVIISLDVSGEKLLLANQKKDFEEKTYKLWLGVGANFLSFSQRFGSDIQSEISFESFQAPEFTLGFSSWLFDHWRFIFEVRNSPGATRSNQNLAVSKGEYFWQAALFEMAYYFNPNYQWQLLWGWRGRTKVLFGGQFQSIPLLKRDASDSVQVFNEGIGVAMVGLGFESFSPARLWSTDIYMRWHQPIGNRIGAATMSSYIGFEGLIGVNRLLTDNLLIGVQWNGQYINFDYSNFDDLPTDSKIDGGLELIHSFLELRLNYLW